MAAVTSRITQPSLPFEGLVPGRRAGRTEAQHGGRASRPPERGRLPPLERPQAAPDAGPDSPIAYVLVRSPRARRYILRLRPDGIVRVTIPPRGSRREAIEVVERHRPWIERQWRQRMAERRAHEVWQDGTRILFRGREVALAVSVARQGWRVAFADQSLHVPSSGRIRDGVEQRLRLLAEQELEPRLRRFAAQHGLAVKQVTVRNQRTRWGSCSRGGCISLNWRLVQMPPAVADYILLHELMHLRQANHSRRFWREVEAVCPGYRDAEAWLRRSGRSLW
jgi:predicted metal-dependent hydrolase